MAKLTKPQAARLINRGERTIREWVERGHVPKQLTTAHIARLRELAGYTRKAGDPEQAPPSEGFNPEGPG